MADEFVKKDVFDARMDRMEALLEKTLIEMKADNAQLRSEMKGEIAQLRSEMKGEIAQLRSDTEAGFAQLRNELKGDIAQLRSDTEAGFAQLRNELKGDIAQLRGETREMGLDLRGEIRALDARVDALQTWQYWQIAWIGILVAAAALIPAVTQYLRKKSEMTVERAREVMERFIEASAAVRGAQ